MTKDTVKNYTLYKLRFWIGYTLLALAVLSVFIFAVIYTPGGITQEEQQSALLSASMQPASPLSFLIIDAPYHLLQKISFFLFNLSSISIKLPSLIMGFATAVILTLLLRKRFSQTTSIIAAGMLVVAAQFISLVATGTPAIMTVFWPSLLLLIAAYAVHDNKLRPAAIYAAGVTTALGIFTPFVLPLVVVLAIAAFIHPRTRYLLRKTPRTPLLVSLGLVFVSCSALLYASFQDVLFAQQLLYRSSSFSLDIIENIRLIALQFADFTSVSIEKTGLLAPAFGLTTLVLAGVGAWRLFRWRHSALSYGVVFWLLCVSAIVLFNPSMLKLFIVPIALLAAAGVGDILNYWYRLFPYNPYARVFALIPLTILFACVILSGAARYFYAFHYSAPLANRTSHDLVLVAQELQASPKSVLLVSKEERSWYQLYLDTHDNKDVLLTTDMSRVVRDGKITQNIIATRASTITASGLRPVRIIASSKLHAPSDRVYLYKKTEK